MKRLLLYVFVFCAYVHHCCTSFLFVPVTPLVQAISNRQQFFATRRAHLSPETKEKISISARSRCRRDKEDKATVLGLNLDVYEELEKQQRRAHRTELQRLRRAKQKLEKNTDELAMSVDERKARNSIQRIKHQQSLSEGGRHALFETMKKIWTTDRFQPANISTRIQQSIQRSGVKAPNRTWSESRRAIQAERMREQWKVKEYREKMSAMAKSQYAASAATLQRKGLLLSTDEGSTSRNSSRDAYIQKRRSGREKDVNILSDTSKGRAEETIDATDTASIPTNIVSSSVSLHDSATSSSHTLYQPSGTSRIASSIAPTCIATGAVKVAGKQGVSVDSIVDSLTDSVLNGLLYLYDCSIFLANSVGWT